LGFSHVPFSVVVVSAGAFFTTIVQVLSYEVCPSAEYALVVIVYVPAFRGELPRVMTRHGDGDCWSHASVMPGGSFVPQSRQTSVPDWPSTLTVSITGGVRFPSTHPGRHA